MRKILHALAAFLCLSAPTLADEVWQTPEGPIIYEQDLGLMAVWSFPYRAFAPGEVPEFADERGTLYFPGLGGNFDNRGIHDGYWLVQGVGGCSARISTADDQNSMRWGRARVIFDNPAFPTSATLLLGRCLEEPTTIIRATRP